MICKSRVDIFFVFTSSQRCLSHLETNSFTHSSFQVRCLHKNVYATFRNCIIVAWLSRLSQRFELSVRALIKLVRRRMNGSRTKVAEKCNLAYLRGLRIDVGNLNAGLSEKLARSLSHFCLCQDFISLSFRFNDEKREVRRSESSSGEKSNWKVGQNGMSRVMQS